MQWLCQQKERAAHGQLHKVHNGGWQKGDRLRTHSLGFLASFLVLRLKEQIPAVLVYDDEYRSYIPSDAASHAKEQIVGLV